MKDFTSRLLLILSVAAAQVSFMACLSKSFVERDDAILFDDIVTNQNDEQADEPAYNPTTGRFIAPANGTYRVENSGPLFVHLMRNEDIVASGTNHDDKFETTSCNAVLILKKGEIIWVRLKHGIVFGGSPSHYSAFSGFMLAPTS
ncbi:Oidioi.mRNA.OKI2018_I69.chr1.g3751.t1.cds [Oikopleura dioica]|uniref:Oidioi.mRNA.OKI2018_I69.chr1.g3751.t1.cds n=1 Tax=Oikopleura dioica TaxID=34765 RepID=A0ABN7T4A8_OIKDI|nr:Oidioi.mRNA.OKI2018_I69.chr1.g3751.t1.cds [Oikopleura dioica]